MDALASRTVVTLERCVVFEKESQVEAAHRSERLGAAVLDSLAHAVKTPLTAIQAATAGLSEVGKLNTAQEELLALVEDETGKLSLLSTRLLQTAKLEAEEFSIAKDELDVGDLVEVVLEEQRGHMSGHSLEVAVSDSNLTLRGDRNRLSTALRHQQPDRTPSAGRHAGRKFCRHARCGARV